VYVSGDVHTQTIEGQQDERSMFESLLIKAAD
jgi:hypothetical protein